MRKSAKNYKAKILRNFLKIFVLFSRDFAFIRGQKSKNESIYFRNFDRNARVALKDATLRGAPKSVRDLGGRRAAAILRLKIGKSCGKKARAIKEETLLHLDIYLEKFAENAEKAARASLGA